MANTPAILPPPISIPRIRILVASLFVSLGSGTNYVSNGSLISLTVDINLRIFIRSTQVRSTFRLSCLRQQANDELLTLPLCSIFTTAGTTPEDISYAVEHYRAGWKWCGIYFDSSILATYLTLFSRGLPLWSDMGSNCRFSWSSHTPCL